MGLANPQALISTLTAYNGEQEWFEFKKDNVSPDDIGEYISALANSAMLENKAKAYLLFGIRDADHAVIGTTVRLENEKIGNEHLINWLHKMLTPSIHLEFSHCEVDGKRVEIIEIGPTYDRPVLFKNVEYIRVQSSKRRLKDYPAKERTLWHLTSRFAFESGLAASNYSRDQIFSEFYCHELAKAIYSSHPMSDINVLESLLSDGLVIDNLQGGYDITNLFVVAAARDLSRFRTVSHKSPRVIIYKGTNKLVGLDDVTGRYGYIVSFPRILRFIGEKVSGKEIFLHGVRKREKFYPEIAIRELVANSLIHQDFIDTGPGPTVEIYDDRIEITNVGESLLDPIRMIDAPPKSRNERLAGLMRAARFCEARGSGVDRACWAIEQAMQAPPMFQVVEGSTIVTMYKHTDFGSMTKEERVRACYQHSVLSHLNGAPMTNGTLRKRLGLNHNQSPAATNVINDTIAAGLIRPLDEDQGKKFAKYLPIWAKTT
ncbi:MAG: transcriptional regulator [Mesorhizobium sp.]|uniref:RNA-binding domain-containing protein n=1 Tax=Mesorhizobium sp. TaxID=1871066 RepID=UPI000FE8BBC4|nr:RNA-binding domain-containing protein [Mesorhizobium sp.]RWF40868.1 MAG: transcriptional regulator [Mesorhizobium sp.]